MVRIVLDHANELHPIDRWRWPFSITFTGGRNNRWLLSRDRRLLCPNLVRLSARSAHDIGLIVE